MGDLGKITELVSTSKKSFEDAISKAVEEMAKKGEKDVRGLKVKNVSVSIENGKISEWRVDLKISSEF